MLDNLPLHIRETIFSRVRYSDLFETARVSQGWWTLTMASFERFHHKKDDFLLDQVDFCNQMMTKDEPWEWWMLMEFTKLKRLYLEISDFNALVSDGKGRLIQYFSSMEIRVKHLRIDKSKSWSDEVLRLPPNLDEVFPCLESLEVAALALESHSTIVFPLHLSSLRFGLERMPSTDSIALNTSELTVLDLKECRFESFYLLDALKFDNLTHLSVSADGFFNMDMQSSLTQKRILKSVLHENKTLKSISVKNAYITKEWLQIFPANVVDIELSKPRLSQDLVKTFGNNIFYERLLLMYVCEDWTSVVKFNTYLMSWEKYQEKEVNDEAMDDGDEEESDDDNEDSLESSDSNGIENAYQVDYMCKPTANEETIFVKYRDVAINELISKNNQGLLLTKLMYYHHSYEVPIPANVRYLSILFDNENYDDNEREFELVLEDPTALQTLIRCHIGFKNRLATVPNMINLRELHIFECDKNLLVSILQSCTSLSKLTLWSRKSTVFGNMSLDIKSLSLKYLTIIGGSDTFEDILKPLPSLNSLTLTEYCTEPILKSDVNAIESLQYFKLCMYGKAEAKEMAVHLSTLQFPYMLFVVNSLSHSYIASKGLELVNELSRHVSKNNIAKASRSFSCYPWSVSHEEGSLVFTKNIPTRFLRNTCHLVNTVQDFVDKSFDVQN